MPAGRAIHTLTILRRGRSLSPSRVESRPDLHPPRGTAFEYLPHI